MTDSIFEEIMGRLIRPRNEGGILGRIDPEALLDGWREDSKGPEAALALNSAFLISLGGPAAPHSSKAERILTQAATNQLWRTTARFYGEAREEIKGEMEDLNLNPETQKAIAALKELQKPTVGQASGTGIAEILWRLFFPEGTGILGHEKESIIKLRRKRRVTIRRPCPEPISDPAGQMLFTANALLTLPPDQKFIRESSLDPALQARILPIYAEPQQYWYDHPVWVGTKGEHNEILYGLKGLAETLDHEKAQGKADRQARLKVAVSVSVTHQGLQAIARTYIRDELRKLGGLPSLDLYLFTETDTRALVREVLAPAASHYLGQDFQETFGRIFGVDGEYGRHYSFLKALAVFWSVLVDPKIEATFKFDLDQVFPQAELEAQTGRSAFDHFKTPLWGALGEDDQGNPVELGMIAGALVNEKDIGKSLFTPDVTFPQDDLPLDGHIFFSALPQALSTRAEMMTRYTADGPLDGKRSCIQRIHVTGGTNGIRVEHLMRHHPFTPTFMGRAEDQAYIMSVLGSDHPRLAYLHADGLIMRHDKEAFAGEAIASAHVGQIIGDYIRTLFFSAYPQALGVKAEKIKETMDPFTGGFISPIPRTIVYLRLALKALDLADKGHKDQALQLIKDGVRRIPPAIAFSTGPDSPLKRQFQEEKSSWHRYYDTLSALKQGLEKGEAFARKMRTRAREIIRQCRI